MFRFEMYKLLVKQHAFYLALIMFLCEIVFFSFIYNSNTFPNENDEREIYKIMQVMEGKLTNEKILYITDELETVSKSRTELQNMQRRLKNGEYKNRNDYAEDYASVQPHLKKEYAVQEVYSKYKYCSADPERRYMISYDFKGMCRDYPDIFALIFIVTVTSFFFLNEETSMMILIIKSNGSRENNIFSVKIKALMTLIVTFHMIISLIEFLFLKFKAGESLDFPIQSIEYFSNCKYGFTIFETFAIIQSLKLLGNLFIALLTALICMTVKKAVVSAGVPLFLCLIQQFAFKEAKYAYYLPVGLLRATGYFRGDSYETIIILGQSVQIKSFSEVPAEILYLVLFEVFFSAIIVSILGSIHYRSCNNDEKNTVRSADNYIV